MRVVTMIMTKAVPKRVRPVQTNIDVPTAMIHHAADGNRTGKRKDHLPGCMRYKLKSKDGQ